jgi:hypothetical protein
MMARYKTPTFKQMAERTFPWRVDIDVPGFGLGPRLDQMHAWCRERGCEWEQHGYQRPRPGEVPQHVVRFYFSERGDALAFLLRWDGELSKRRGR